jgi:hypothetical protein
MPTHPLATPIAHDFLTDAIRIGEPDMCGPLAVFPLFGPDPDVDYVGFAQAVTTGMTVKELDSGASVNDLLVLNPTDHNVLLYEGEEVLGAQQNRTFDVSILVAAGSRLRVPVSCVEHGRWDSSRSSEAFSPAPQTAYPELRRLKNQQARVAAAQGREARALQGEVWSAIAHKSARMATHSPTSAMHDIYEGRRARIAEFRDAIRLHDGQSGTLVCLGGRPTVVDYVSRPGVFAALHGPLVQGYALDALEVGDAIAPADGEIAQEFLDAALGASVSQSDGIGLGRDIRFTDKNVGGAGLVAGDELVQLTAFAESGEDGPVGPTLSARIRRPSRRRAG